MGAINRAMGIVGQGVDDFSRIAQRSITPEEMHLVKTPDELISHVRNFGTPSPTAWVPKADAPGGFAFGGFDRGAMTEGTRGGLFGRGARPGVMGEPIWVPKNPGPPPPMSDDKILANGIAKFNSTTDEMASKTERIQILRQKAKTDLDDNQLLIDTKTKDGQDRIAQLLDDEVAGNPVNPTLLPNAIADFTEAVSRMFDGVDLAATIKGLDDVYATQLARVTATKNGVATLGRTVEREALAAEIAAANLDLTKTIKGMGTEARDFTAARARMNTATKDAIGQEAAAQKVSADGLSGPALFSTTGTAQRDADIAKMVTQMVGDALTSGREARNLSAPAAAQAAHAAEGANALHELLKPAQEAVEALA